MSDTHFSKLEGTKLRIELGQEALPSRPQDGDFFFDSFNNRWAVYYQSNWWYRAATTTTSTSTSTTTTSTSTTTTSTSSSTTTSTSSSTSTSTTTTL
jgi:hypothetical protein